MILKLVVSRLNYKIYSRIDFMLQLMTASLLFDLKTHYPSALEKNINCLSAGELHDPREVLASLYQIADTHP